MIPICICLCAYILLYFSVLLVKDYDRLPHLVHFRIRILKISNRSGYSISRSYIYNFSSLKIHFSRKFSFTVIIHQVYPNHCKYLEHNPSFIEERLLVSSLNLLYWKFIIILIIIKDWFKISWNYPDVSFIVKYLNNDSI